MDQHLRHLPREHPHTHTHTRAQAHPAKKQSYRENEREKKKSERREKEMIKIKKERGRKKEGEKRKEEEGERRKRELPRLTLMRFSASGGAAANPSARAATSARKVAAGKTFDTSPILKASSLLTFSFSMYISLAFPAPTTLERFGMYSRHSNATVDNSQ